MRKYIFFYFSSARSW